MIAAMNETPFEMGGFIETIRDQRIPTLRYIHKDLAYYSSELELATTTLQEANIPPERALLMLAEANIPPARALLMLAEANKVQQEMQRLEDSISRNRRISWVLNSDTRRQLMKLAERHIDATRWMLRLFSELCGGALPDLWKPQKFEALRTVEEGGRSIIDLFQKGKLNLVGVVGPADAGKMVVVREVERLFGKDQTFRHHVLWVDLGVRCDSIEKAERKIGSALGILQKKMERHGNTSTNAMDPPDGAAEKLLKTLIALGPTLVILNDVWLRLENLELVGIPGRKDCRVMVVSHSRCVCKEMKCQAIVELQELVPTAEDPFPVLNLKMGIVRNIKGYHDFPQVYELLTQDAKSILSLCCLFPSLHGIAIEELTRFAVAAQILLPNDGGDNSFQAARERIQNIATELSDSHLLLYANEQQLVLKMPDAVHTRACQMTSLGSILLVASGDIVLDQTFFEKLNHASLTLLTLTGNIQSLQGIQSLSTNLRALHMEHCKLLNSNNGNHDLIKLIGQLTQLEILSFSGSDIQHLPMELGGLKNLKLLDLSGCTDLQRIPEHLIPNWPNLEELYIGDFKNWSEPLAATTWRSASIEEVVHLPCLVTLFLTATINQLPSHCVFPTKLQSYRILINGNTQVGGNHHAYPIPTAVSSAIRISSFSALSLCIGLFSKVEYLNLKDIAGPRSFLRDSSLPALKFLVIEDCRDLEYLVDATSTSGLSNLQHLELINLEKFTCLVEGPGGLDLQHLETLIIKDCVHLEQIFGLEQLSFQLPALQTIELKKLSNLTRICSEGTSSTAMPKLRKLCVERCPNLESADAILPPTQPQQMPPATLETLILGGQFRKRAEKPEDLTIGNFTPFKFQPGYLYTNLKHLELRGLPLEQLWKDETQIIGLQTLTDLRVIECKELRCIFTATICRNMPQLRNLKISECHKLEQIIEEDEIFSSSDAQRISCFPNLTNLEVSGCPKLTTIFPINVTYLPKLKTLSIKYSEKLTCVFQAKCIPDGASKEQEVKLLQLQEVKPPKLQELKLPQLQEVKLHGLDSLEAFTSQGFEFTFPSLKIPEVIDCPLIEDSFRSLKGVRHEEVPRMPRSSQDPRLRIATASTSKRRRQRRRRRQRLATASPSLVVPRPSTEIREED